MFKTPPIVLSFVTSALVVTGLLMQTANASQTSDQNDPNCKTLDVDGVPTSECCPEWAQPELSNMGQPYCGAISVCPDLGVNMAVTLPSLTGSPRFHIKPYRIDLPEVNTGFTSVNKSDSATFCTLQSPQAMVGINLTIPSLGISHQLGSMGLSATLNFYSVGTTDIQVCNFKSGPIDGCILTAPTTPNDVLIKWLTPGFQPYYGSKTGANSGQLIYYASANALGIQNAANSITYGQNLNTIEDFFHKTLAEAIPYIVPLAVFQEPPGNNFLVRDPAGNLTGKTSNGQLLTEIWGSSYGNLGNITYLIIPKPINGLYQIQVTGNSTGPFTLSTSNVNFTGNFTSPNSNEVTLNGTIGTNQTKSYNVLLNQSSGKFQNLTAGLGFPTSQILGTGFNAAVDKYDPVSGKTTKLFDIPSTVPPPYHNGRGLAFDGTNVWYTVVGTTTQIGDGRIHKSSLNGKDLGYIPDPYGEGGRGIGALVFDKQGFLWAVSYNPANSSQTIFKLNSTNGHIVASCTARSLNGPSAGYDTTLAIVNGRILTDLGSAGVGLHQLFEFDLPTTVGGNCTQTNAYKIPNVYSGFRLEGMDSESNGNLIATNGTALFNLGPAPYNTVGSTRPGVFGGAEDIAVVNQTTPSSASLSLRLPYETKTLHN
jgi:hypothetical protein